jgi:uncharacterized iron-regulated protein
MPPAPFAAATLLLLPATLAAQPELDSYAIHAATGERVELPELADALAGYDVVFLGEVHDDAVTHRLQAALLEEIGRRRPRALLSLEMFERDVQVPLDEYAAGRTEEEPFLAAARPWPNYAADYRPLVEQARAHGWPVVAANVPRPLAAMVGRGGMAALDTLPEGHRRWFAAHRECAPEGEYFRRFADAMGGMEGHGGSAAVERFYAAQCLKDETMAESIVRARQAWPGWLTVHVNGGFHSDFRLGTVERLARREPSLRIAVVAMVPVPDPAAAHPAEHAGRGDWIVFTRQASRRAARR